MDIMERGGPSWSRFSFKKWSNAKEFRLFIPRGRRGYPLSAQDILDNYQKAQTYKKLLYENQELKATIDGSLALENHELKAEVNRLLVERDKTAAHFTGTEIRQILDVLFLIDQKLREVAVTVPRTNGAYRLMHAVNAGRKMRYR